MNRSRGAFRLPHRAATAAAAAPAAVRPALPHRIASDSSMFPGLLACRVPRLYPGDVHGYMGDSPPPPPRISLPPFPSPSVLVPLPPPTPISPSHAHPHSPIHTMLPPSLITQPDVATGRVTNSFAPISFPTNSRAPAMPRISAPMAAPFAPPPPPPPRAAGSCCGVVSDCAGRHCARSV